MKITVNGVGREVRSTMLAEALEELDYATAVIATALNGHFVATAARSSTVLAEGDQVEVVAPMQGG
ncbi:MAG: sulfur carrier protein ThiS [Rhodanobacter sp.]|nr:MAG: sulfur carrier protein ThiS [Rhodanobacter sp.]